MKRQEKIAAILLAVATALIIGCGSLFYVMASRDLVGGMMEFIYIVTIIFFFIGIVTFLNTFIYLIIRLFKIDKK